MCVRTAMLSIFSGIFSAYLLEHTILLLVTSLVGAYLLSTVIIGFVALIGGSQAADPGIFFIVLIALCILGLFCQYSFVRSYLNPSVSNEHQMGRYAAKEEGPDEAQLDLPPAEAGDRISSRQARRSREEGAMATAPRSYYAGEQRQQDQEADLYTDPEGESLYASDGAFDALDRAIQRAQGRRPSDLK